MKKQLRNYQCVIFGCDNVLVDTETTIISVLMDMASAYGVELEADEALKLFCGRKIADTIAILEKRSGQRFPFDFEESFRKQACEEFKKGVLPVEGAEAILASLDIPFCVASSGPREKIILKLTLTNLIGYFDEKRIFSCCDIRIRKPQADIFIHAASVMGFGPEGCAVIQDSIAGVQAAKSGGFTVFGFTNGYNYRELESHGAIVFDHMDDLQSLLSIDI